MGRKTWDSIPAKFRPLPQRTNLVISRQDATKFVPSSLLESGEVLVAQDIASGLAALQQQAQAGRSKALGRVFVIGGGAIYKSALEMEEARHVLLTRVRGEWDCDTQFPVDVEEDLQWVRSRKDELERFTGESFDNGALIEEEVKGVKHEFEFMLYEKK
ncbi:hypothetical protein AAFC00_000376 [Neodothiora populina]